MRSEVLDCLYEARRILSGYRDPRNEISELKRQMENSNPYSKDYIVSGENQTYSPIDFGKIFGALGIAVLGSAIATLVFRILSAIILSIIWAIGAGMYPRTHETHDKVKAFIFKIPMWISDNLLEGRPGLLTSEPTFLEKSLFGMLIMFLVIGFVIAVIYIVWNIMGTVKDNDRKKAAIRQERKILNEQKEKFRKNLDSYGEYCERVNAEIDKISRDDRATQMRLASLLDKVNCPLQYRNIQAINMFINYIESGRAYDIVGAINQINYDANQRQLIAETQATRAAYESAARAAQNAARAAQNAADATSQANQDAWYRYYSRK